MAVTTIGAIAAVAGGAIAANGAKSAARTQSRSADAAVDEQQRQFAQTQANEAPWLDAGKNALANLQNPNAFAASPGYEFRRNEGMRGIQQNAGAGGGAFSGNALRALSEYNSNLASQEYGNWFGQQAQVAGLGQGSANALGQFGQNASNNIGNALMAGGDARASGIAAQSNALGGTLQSLTNNWLYNRQSGVGGGIGSRTSPSMFGAGLGSSSSGGLNNTTLGQWNPNTWGRA